MRLASFAAGGRDRIGFALGAGAGAPLVDLNQALAFAGRPERFADMIAFIAAGPPALAAARRAEAAVRAAPGAVERFDPAAVRWHPPVRRPWKICGIALNNSASDARKISAPDHPLFFLKPASCLIGHGEPIVTPPHFGSVHPEPELAVVIGQDCKNVPEAEAMEVVFGYTILNDMTGNDMRAEDRVHYWALYPSAADPDVLERREQHLSYTARYKGADGFGPMGPFLVTKDEVPDPHALEVRCWHKGELIAEDSTAFYTWSVPAVIAWITRFQSLWAGDVIAMGTAFRPGAGARRGLHTANVTARGGPVAVEITGLGRLENPVDNR